MFRHPKYYKELRKLRNKLDQAISYDDSTESQGVRPDPGLKPQATSYKLRAESDKRVAAASLGFISASSRRLLLSAGLRAGEGVGRGARRRRDPGRGFWERWRAEMRRVREREAGWCQRVGGHTWP